MLTIAIATTSLLLGLAVGLLWTVITSTQDKGAANARAEAHLLRDTVAAQRAELLDRIAELTLAHLQVEDLQAQLTNLTEAHDRLWAHYTGAHDEIALRRRAQDQQSQPVSRGYLAHPSHGAGAVIDSIL